jgi:hypothetical protein
MTLTDMSHTLFYFILLSSDENLPQNKCCLGLAILILILLNPQWQDYSIFNNFYIMIRRSKFLYFL